MARLAPPVWSPVDVNGDVYPGAQLETFASGTTTPLVAFADAALTIPLTNPIIADAKGQFPEIFLDGSGYKLILKDADDVLIGEFDPVFGVAAPEDIQLAFSTAIESFTALAGQTVFTLLSHTYVPGDNQLAVTINGVYQIVDTHYTETSASSITFTSPLEADDLVAIVVGIAVTNAQTRFNTLALNDGAVLTLASGAITITHSAHPVDTEGAASSDDLTTINGGTAGQLLILRAFDTNRTVRCIDATGNLALVGTFSLNSTDDRIVLQSDGTNWVELSRSDNGA